MYQGLSWEELKSLINFDVFWSGSSLPAVSLNTYPYVVGVGVGVHVLECVLLSLN
jgi:hypothetical protein